jgi:hypothetical protein
MRDGEEREGPGHVEKRLQREEKKNALHDLFSWAALGK